MNWLHCFWGIGASAGPVIVSLCLAQRDSWSLGYRVIGLLQFALVAVLAGSLPLWRRVETAPEEAARTGVHLGIAALLRLPGAKPILLAFFCYCTLESTVGLWGSSYLVVVRGVEAEVAARWIALYYLGITLGRLGAGFLTARLAHRQMIRLGWVTVAVGIAILLLPAGGVAPVAGLFLIGLGCAPIFPSLLHGTPDNFGSAHSQAIMGIQMACAYLGTTLMPPLFGLLAARVGYALFPWYALGFLVLLAAMVEHFARSRGRGGAASAPPSR